MPRLTPTQERVTISKTRNGTRVVVLLPAYTTPSGALDPEPAARAASDLLAHRAGQPTRWTDTVRAMPLDEYAYLVRWTEAIGAGEAEERMEVCADPAAVGELCAHVDVNPWLADGPCVYQLVPVRR